MNAPPRKGPLAWLKGLEARASAWAMRCLSPEEYAEASAFDHRLKDNFWRWLGQFALVTVMLGLIAFAIWPQLGFGRAVFFAALAAVYVLVTVASAWYGWRKYTKRPAWKVLAIFFLLLLGGAVVGFAVGNLHHGKGLADIDTAKLVRAIGVAAAVGLALASVLLGVAHFRLREANLKAARLQAEADSERLARHGTQAELKLLQAQVEPHFLFNTLANVRHLVHTGSPDALAMLDHLIRYLRTALPELRSDSSTLGREGELARAYLEIMRLRMGGALEFSIDIPADLAPMSFPPLMLMTLVENAIKHGVAPMGRGRIALRASEASGRVRVTIEDDGGGLGGEIGQGLGLGNVRERLRALYGESARLELLGREPSGARAVIEVPA